MDQQARSLSGGKARYDVSGTAARVLVLSDVHIVRYGLGVVLRAARTEWNVAMCASPAEALGVHAETESGASATAADYDIVVLDMSMHGALECARELTQNLAIRVVAFAAVDSDDALLAYVEAGIVGFVPREGSVVDLIATIDGALSGDPRLSPRLTVALMRRLAELRTVREPVTPSPALTPREREILRLIDEGLSNKQIATRLLIEIATVKNHVHNILEKTRASRRGEAAALLRRGRRSI